VLTTQRVLFLEIKFFRTVLSVAFLPPTLGRWVTGQRGHRVPLVDLPLTSLAAIEWAGRRAYPDRIALLTEQHEYLFNGGWTDWEQVLRHTLETEHGRRLIEEEPERWRVSPS
jgi:hypothetical protein